MSDELRQRSGGVHIRAVVVGGHTFSVSSNFDLTQGRILGLGTYGVVSSAVNKLTGGHIAVKRIRPYASDEWDARHTLRELRLLKLLAPHPNIISLNELSLFEEKLELYMMLELMDCDLSYLIDSKQKLSESHIKCFGKQILEGVKAMHSLKIFHRDLKPGNILVTKDCHLRITDFGMARYMDQLTLQGENNESPMSEYVVTRWYRAPELLLAPMKPYTAAIDIWAVGCILAELIRKEPLFPGSSPGKQVQMIFKLLGYDGRPKTLGIDLEEEAADYLEKNCVFPAQDFCGGAFLATSDYANGKSSAESRVSLDCVSLVSSLLGVNPNLRPSAADALRFHFFHDTKTFYDYSKTYVRSPPKGYFDFEAERCVFSDLKEMIVAEVMCGAKMRAPVSVKKTDGKGTQRWTKVPNSGIATSPTSSSTHVTSNGAEQISQHTKTASRARGGRGRSSFSVPSDLVPHQNTEDDTPPVKARQKGGRGQRPLESSSGSYSDSLSPRRFGGLTLANLHSGGGSSGGCGGSKEEDGIDAVIKRQTSALTLQLQRQRLENGGNELTRSSLVPRKSALSSAWTADEKLTAKAEFAQAYHSHQWQRGVSHLPPSVAQDDPRLEQIVDLLPLAEEAGTPYRGPHGTKQQQLCQISLRGEIDDNVIEVALPHVTKFADGGTEDSRRRTTGCGRETLLDATEVMDDAAVRLTALEQSYWTSVGGRSSADGGHTPVNGVFEVDVHEYGAPGKLFQSEEASQASVSTRVQPPRPWPGITNRYSGYTEGPLDRSSHGAKSISKEKSLSADAKKKRSSFFASIMPGMSSKSPDAAAGPSSSILPSIISTAGSLLVSLGRSRYDSPLPSKEEREAMRRARRARNETMTKLDGSSAYWKPSYVGPSELDESLHSSTTIESSGPYSGQAESASAGISGPNIIRPKAVRPIALHSNRPKDWLR